MSVINCGANGVCKETFLLLHFPDVSNRPIRLTQCCTEFKPFGNKTFCFKNFHII